MEVVWALMVARGEGHAGRASMSERFRATHDGRPSRPTLPHSATLAPTVVDEHFLD